MHNLRAIKGYNRDSNKVRLRVSLTMSTIQRKYKLKNEFEQKKYLFVCTANAK